MAPFLDLGCWRLRLLLPQAAGVHLRPLKLKWFFHHQPDRRPTRLLVFAPLPESSFLMNGHQITNTAYMDSDHHGWMLALWPLEQFPYTSVRLPLSTRLA